MCGLAGFTAPGADALAVVRRMTAALVHRGPDGFGEFIDAGIALGHRRLAIIDLAGGAQPRVDTASGDALIFNGEIYGYRGPRPGPARERGRAARPLRHRGAVPDAAAFGRTPDAGGDRRHVRLRLPRRQ